MNSDTMTPPRMTSTPIAAARVRIRKMASPSRSRSSALARDIRSSPTATSPCNATSTTARLPAGSIGLSLGSSRRAQSSGPVLAAQDVNEALYLFPRIHPLPVSGRGLGQQLGQHWNARHRQLVGVNTGLPASSLISCQLL